MTSRARGKNNARSFFAFLSDAHRVHIFCFPDMVEVYKTAQAFTNLWEKRLKRLFKKSDQVKLNETGDEENGEKPD
jgi:hypothetical protein